MKTVSEAAAILGVSTVAIYKKINKSLQTVMEPHVNKVTENGKTKTVIDDVGIEILRKSLVSVNKPPEEIANGLETVSKELANDGLLTVIELLENQLKEKDRQIESLCERNKDLLEQLKTERERMHELMTRHTENISTISQSITKLLENQQQLQAMDKLPRLTEGEAAPPKKGFWPWKKKVEQ